MDTLNPTDSSPRPLILLSNDDGYTSPGLHNLRTTLLTWADVVVIAPEQQQSAASHAISLHHPLRLRAIEPFFFALDGTPADCVYTALHADGRLLPRRPDLVMSGINYGLNLGQDVFYSGTVAAAREGALCGLPAIAISAHREAPLQPVADLGLQLAQLVFAHRHTHPPALLNVNVPDPWRGKTRATTLGTRLYHQAVEFRTDPRGKEYLWIGGSDRVSHRKEERGSDTLAFDEGIASITPLLLDLTQPTALTYAEILAASLS